MSFGTMQNKTLYLFTDKYPFDEGEQYLDNEVRILASQFQRIVLLPQTRSAYQRPLPDNIEVKFLGDEIQYKKSLLLKNIPLLFSVLLTEWKHGRKNLRTLGNIKIALQQFYNALCLANAFDRFLTNEPESERYFYSYWFYQWSTMLALLKKKGRIQNFVSRAHGGDLYSVFTERPNFLRAFRLQQITKLRPCSEHGANHLRAMYPAFTAKIETAYLGVSPRNPNPVYSDAEFTVVSCSSVSGFKRVDLIASSLALLDFKVRWVHFGHGNALDKLREQCAQLPPNIKAELRGFVHNDRVQEFYQTETVHAFIHLSKYEGLPVSMMEAAAVGIPMICTGISGVPEIVVETTGLLLPEMPQAEEVAACITKIYKTDTAQLRTGGIAMHKKQFTDSTNYLAFIRDMLPN
jgi:glycosyltransferase involved in cell wall biosynthesis